LNRKHTRRPCESLGRGRNEREEIRTFDGEARLRSIPKTFWHFSPTSSAGKSPDQKTGVSLLAGKSRFLSNPNRTTHIGLPWADIRQSTKDGSPNWLKGGQDFKREGRWPLSRTLNHHGSQKTHGGITLLPDLESF